MLITKDLFQKILLAPAKSGCDSLYIVAGYASATMVSKHLENLSKLTKYVRIELIVGMCPKDGLLRKNHLAFQLLTSDAYPANFGCRYLIKKPAVHSKIYSWFKDKSPSYGFTGSANYTQTAFENSQREIIVASSAKEGKEYFDKLLPDTLDCRDSEAEDKINIYDVPFYIKPENVIKEVVAKKGKSRITEGLEKITTSLLASSGNLPQRSGLNWGQRPEYSRNPNQAYIRLPAAIYRTDFFPEITKHFTVLTDDGNIMICARAQANGKAIHTPQDNSILGEYFRNRLGLSYGSPVSKKDLLKYGRTDIDFFRIDEETYFMDFSPKKKWII